MKLFDLTKSQGRVLYCAAPMVRYSKVSINLSCLFIFACLLRFQSFSSFLGIVFLGVVFLLRSGWESLTFAGSWSWIAVDNSCLSVCPCGGFVWREARWMEGLRVRYFAVFFWE